MAKVRRLPSDLANQIAAGEVVERPASVVKELLENSLDAGASRVRVDVEGGGVSVLRVSDDGAGMDEEDARLAVERHATSKITKLDDLLALETFGFRGEALPSIASVSRFALRTRRREVEEGLELRIDAGGSPVVKPCGMAPGTTVEVRDLFYNVPARRKFLKAQATESAHIGDVVEAMALASPHMTVTLAREGRVVREWLRRETRTERARESFGSEEISELTGSRGPMSMLAVLGRPERARASTSALKLFVNGRVVRDRILTRTICQAYGTVLPPGRYPVGVVFLEIAPDRVDVNVHPQKAEVRFADGRAVADALFSVLSLELGKAFGLAPAQRGFFGGARLTTESPKPAPEAGPQAAWSWSGGTVTAPPPVATDDRRPTIPDDLPPASIEDDPWQLGGDPAPRQAQSPVVTYPPLGDRSKDETDATLRADPDARESFSALRFVAQVRQTFLLCEGREGLYVLDQHAAAERVTFDRLKRAFHAKKVAVQPLLFPVVIDVLAEDAALVEEEHESLLAAGVDARTVGPRSVAVHGVPQLLLRASPERLLRDLLAEASRTGHAAFREAMDIALATMACHGSVRAGDRVAPEEAIALLSALDDVDFAGHCPHGRPIVTMLTWMDLERRVGRR